MSKLTQKQCETKLKKYFGKCPFCGSEDLNATDWDGDKTVTCKVDCNVCTSEWREHYRFISATGFKQPDHSEDARRVIVRVTVEGGVVQDVAVTDRNGYDIPHVADIKDLDETGDESNGEQ